MIKPLHIVAVLALAVFASCGAGDRVHATKGDFSVADSIQDEIDSREQRTFLDAKKAQLLNDVPQAINLYTECLRINPENAAAMYELAKIYAGNQKYDAALAFSKDAVKRSPKNKWYLLQYADALGTTKKYKEAAAVYQELLAQNPDEPNYYLTAAILYLKAGKPNEAIQMFEGLEKHTGVSEELIQQKEQLYMRMGKVKEAAAELEKLIQLDPTEARYYGMMAELYESTNQADKAKETYDRMLKACPDNGMTALSMAQYYFNKRDQANYQLYLNRCIQSTDLTIDMKMAVLGPLLEQCIVDSTKVAPAKAAVALLRSAHPTDAKVYAISGDLNLQEKDLLAAESDYKKSISLDNKEFGVWQQLLFIESDLHQFDSLLYYSEEAKGLFPTQALVFFFNGIANSQLKKHNEAIKALKKGVVMCGDNRPLQTQFYSSLGDAYHALGRHGASDSSYEKALQLKPDEVYVMNNYAYYLSLRQENLERAAALSKRSIELSPGNASFEDTYGWILFRQNKLDEAKSWIEKALAHVNNENNPTLLEHLGDVYAKMGNESKALEYWNKAQSHNSDSTTLAKKIAARKFLEE